MKKPELPPSQKHIPVILHLPDTGRCTRCRGSMKKGSLFQALKKEKLCLKCAGLDQLEFLPSGDVAMTRRASKHSTKWAVVFRENRRRRRHEREGVLVEKAALRQAREECTKDADTRAVAREKAAVRREIQDAQYIEEFGLRVKQMFPSCPARHARTIAQHACEKHSGRVGRTAFAKNLEDSAVRLAVRAHIRHEYTPYDRLLEKGVKRQDARKMISERVAEVVEKWRQG